MSCLLLYLALSLIRMFCLIDCAMNGNAIVITSNIRDFRNAQEALGLQVMTPIEFVNVLDIGDEL
jgi:hypothetical protein